MCLKHQMLDLDDIKVEGRRRVIRLWQRSWRKVRLSWNLMRGEVHGRRSETTIPGLIVWSTFTLGTYVSCTILLGRMSTPSIRGDERYVESAWRLVPGLIVWSAFTLGTYVSRTIILGRMSTPNIRGRYKTACWYVQYFIVINLSLSYTW